MRYFLVTYYKKPNGQMDEVVTVAKHVRQKDNASCSVILDFVKKAVLKCSVNGQSGSRDFETVRNYYVQHYPNVIARLEQEITSNLLDTNEKENTAG